MSLSGQFKNCPPNQPDRANCSILRTSAIKEMRFNLFEVGGCVRDALLGIPSKDVDFVAVAHEDQNFPSAQDAFRALLEDLLNDGFQVFLSTPEFLTIRARVPNTHVLRSRTDVADFVLARRDGPSSDGRRPDFVVPGTLRDDLARRDFTMNAIARSSCGSFLVDPFDGVNDIQAQQIRFVGNPEDRIMEDGLRTVRAVRFSITKGFRLHSDTLNAVNSELAADMLFSVSPERIREELNKMFAADTVASMNLLTSLNPIFVQNLFRGNLNLQATLKKL